MAVTAGADFYDLTQQGFQLTDAALSASRASIEGHYGMEVDPDRRNFLIFMFKLFLRTMNTSSLHPNLRCYVYVSLFCIFAAVLNGTQRTVDPDALAQWSFSARVSLPWMCKPSTLSWLKRRAQRG